VFSVDSSRAKMLALGSESIQSHLYCHCIVHPPLLIRNSYA
jgi:hypothetical protein